MNFVSSRILGFNLLILAIAISTNGCGESEPDVSRQLSDTIHFDPTTEPVPTIVQPHAPPNYVEQARLHVEEARWDEAIQIYTTALRHPWPETVEEQVIRSHQAEISLLRGKAFLAKSFPRIAIKDFTDAIQYGDDDLKSQALVQRARALSELKRWAPAVNDCTRAIRLQPANGQAFLVQAQAFAKLDKPADARTAVLEAERLGIRTTWKVPVTQPALTALVSARSALALNKPIVAREILQTAALEGADTWETNALLALTHFQLYEFQAAITASTRAMSVNPDYADAYRIRGLSWFQRNSLDRAIADLRTAISLDASLTEQLNPYLTEARRRGGVDPGIRVKVISQIRQLVAANSVEASVPTSAEQWLLELIEMPKSTQQIAHFQTFLKNTPENRFNSLGWLTDFLMIDRKLPAVTVLTTWLDREAAPVSSLEQRLREALKSRSTAASQGVNLFADFAAYTIEYRFYELLQDCIDLGTCLLTIDHMHQAVEADDSRSLKLILPHTTLVDREVTGLLRHCIENNRKDQARLIVKQNPDSLSWQIIDFLGLTDELEGLKNAEELTRSSSPRGFAADTRQ